MTNTTSETGESERAAWVATWDRDLADGLCTREQYDAAMSEEARGTADVAAYRRRVAAASRQDRPASCAVRGRRIVTTKKQEQPVSTTGPAPIKALSVAQVRKALSEGREVRRELEHRIEQMHHVNPSDAAARAR